MAGLAILMGVDSTTGLAWVRSKAWASRGGNCFGLLFRHHFKRRFPLAGDDFAGNGRNGNPARARHAIGHPHGIARRADGAGQPFAGPALVAGGFLDIGHQGAKPCLGLVGQKGFQGFAGRIPALGGDGGAGKGISAFK